LLLSNLNNSKLRCRKDVKRMTLRGLVWLVLVAIVASLLAEAGSERANAAVRLKRNQCRQVGFQQPKTFRCLFSKRRSVRVSVDTTGAQSLKWSMQCFFLPDVTLHNGLRFPPRRSYDVWINSEIEPLAFDLLSFTSCSMLIKVWLKPGAHVASWSYHSKRSFLP
jgi:hypothetical protein